MRETFGGGKEKQSSNKGTLASSNLSRPPISSEGHETSAVGVSMLGQGGDNGIDHSVERLGEAVDAKLVLSAQRERLARQMKLHSSPDLVESPTKFGLRRSDDGRISPSLASSFATPPTTTSTDSTKTMIGDVPSANRTPSYPFPSMTSSTVESRNQPSPSLSSRSPQPFGSAGGNRDKLLSAGSTPSALTTFLPPGATPIEGTTSNPEYPAPNLYDLTLLLNSEPGLRTWWSNVVQIMQDTFYADRVTLSVPTDMTDLENVPWGQRATFDANEPGFGRYGNSSDEERTPHLPDSTKGAEKAKPDSISNAGLSPLSPHTIEPSQRSPRPTVRRRKSYSESDSRASNSYKRGSSRPHLPRQSSHGSPLGSDDTCWNGKS